MLLVLAACFSPWSTKAQKPSGIPAPPLVQPIDPKLNGYIVQHCNITLNQNQLADLERQLTMGPGSFAVLNLSCN